MRQSYIPNIQLQTSVQCGLMEPRFGVFCGGRWSCDFHRTPRSVHRPLSGCPRELWAPAVRSLVFQISRIKSVLGEDKNKLCEASQLQEWSVKSDEFWINVRLSNYEIICTAHTWAGRGKTLCSVISFSTKSMSPEMSSSSSICKFRFKVVYWNYSIYDKQTLRRNQHTVKLQIIAPYSCAAH